MVPCCGDDVGLNDISIEQDYSDFALTTLEQAASIPQEDYSVDFDNDEAPMAADISSSKDEDMILS